MTWLLKIKRRAQNAAVAWLDLGVGVERPKRPSGDLLLDHSNADNLEDWPGAVSDWEQPWADAGPVDHAAWMKSMTDPQTPDEIRRAAIGAQRIRDAMHEQALREGDDFIHGMTDGGAA